MRLRVSCLMVHVVLLVSIVVIGLLVRPPCYVFIATVFRHVLEWAMVVR